MKRLISSIITAVTVMLTATGCGRYTDSNNTQAESPAHNLTNLSADVKASVASDYKYTIQDVINLQDFLLSRPTEEDLTGKPYDLTGDDRWDVFDLCLMRREIVDQMNAQSDTLVIYFSRTGNTEKIAEYLKELTDADSYVIEAAIPYTNDDIKYQDDKCRANKEQNDKSVRPEIANPIDSIASYDTIFLGYPIWWGQEPRIIDTFLESFDFSDKTVIPFCTSGSSGIAASEKNIADLVPIGNQLDGRRFPASATKDDVKEWVDTLPLNNEKSETKLLISVGDTELTATLADNSSAQALVELLKQGNISVDMSDYSNFEKVGELQESLPTNDEQLDTDYGDLILYQGNKFVIYYDKNSWSFTKLGRIDNITQEELKSILGESDVTVMLSLK
ncbi:flavodoxin [Ruminococcus sp.]|uniref:flavodoxin n=1 Tax=Ruminococcus sp. TaxID=41978 RepID=UPI0025F7E54F|nr:flavodoxin [Ruminococcus sp.]